MSERGYICLDRGALNHEFFRRKEYSEFEAWVWMLTEAAWKPRARRIGEFMISLARGELVASIRHLMRTWAWSQGKVDRFISRLKNETMVDTRTDTGITIITICNYNKYQLGAPEMDTASDTEADTGTGHQRIQGRIRGRDGDGYTPGYNTEEIKHLNIETVEGASAPLATKVSRKKSKLPMPDIFVMADKHREYAAKNGFFGVIAERMFVAFKNHHGAAGSLFADWNLAWNKWVDNQVKFDAQRLARSEAKRIPRI